MVGTPLSRAVATDLAILRIESELPFTVLTATLLLARLCRARRLLRMKSGRSELPLAETALPLIHPFKISGYGNALSTDVCKVGAWISPAAEPSTSSR
jgi:hypothetical protein